MSEAGRFALLAAPYLLTWVLLLFAMPNRPLVRALTSALAGGLVWGGLVFWEDWAEGFCCREYPATLWTEKWLLVGDVMFLALVALVPIGALELIRLFTRK
ncbi:MAG: hypothetical protein ACKOQM_04325 [Novosphingobium sp.]